MRRSSTRATWQAAQHPSGRRLTPARGGTSLLTGLVRCAACRYCLQATTSSRGKRIYRCTRTHAGGVCPAPARIMSDDIEHAVVEAFWSLARKAEAVGRPLAGHRVEALREALERADARVRQLETPEAQDALGERYFTVFRERRAERDDRAREVGDAEAADRADATLPDVETLEAEWTRATTAAQRELMAIHIDCISLSRDRMIVVYPRGAGPSDLPRRGFKSSPVLAPFPDTPGGARIARL